MTFRSHIFVFKEAWILSKSNLRDSKYLEKTPKYVIFEDHESNFVFSSATKTKKLISWTKKLNVQSILGKKN